MGMDKFYRDSIILTISNLFTGIIGFIFSIILSRKLGTEGLGLYGLISPVYGLLLCLVSEGLVTAVSKISTVYFSRRDHLNLNRTVTTVIYFILFWSVAVAVIFFISSSFTGSNIIKDTRSTYALKVICPALVFVALSAILKGYFYGIGQFKVAAVIDISEKILRVTALLGIVGFLPSHDTKSTVTAAYSALTIGEFTSFILLYSAYRIYSGKYTTLSSKPESRPQLLFNVLAISLPLCLNGFLSSILTTVSTLLLPRRLMYTGIPYESALSMIGKFLGMSLNITYFPMIIVGSISVVLVPDLSLSLSRKNYWATETRILQVLKISSLVGISTLVICLCIPDALGELFYGRTDLGGLIRFAAVSSIINYISAPTYGILNGLGKQSIILRNSLTVSVQWLILIYILAGIPSVNIYGYGIALMVTSLTSLVMNIYEIKKCCDIKLPVAETASLFIVGGLSYLLLQVIGNLLPDSLIILKSIAVCAMGVMLVFSMSKLLYTENSN